MEVLAVVIPALIGFYIGYKHGDKILGYFKKGDK